MKPPGAVSITLDEANRRIQNLGANGSAPPDPAAAALTKIQSLFADGRSRSAAESWLLVPRKNGRTMAVHLFGDGGDNLAREAIATVYAAGDPPPPPEDQAPATKLDARAATSSKNGKKGGRPEAPQHAETADMFAKDVLTQGGHLTARYWHGQWFMFTPSGWREVADTELQNQIVTYLRGRADLRAHATAHYAASVLLNLRAHDLCGLSESIKRPCWLDTNEPAANQIAFANGIVVDVMEYATQRAAGKVPSHYSRPVSPEFFSHDFVAYDWNPDATADKFNAYLARVQPDAEQAIAICRMLGLLVADTARFEVFWQLFGNGANGKTVLLDIIRALVGTSNVSYVPLSGLVERFQQWPLAYNKVNICGELPTDVGRGQYHQIEGTFKDCISGGAIEVEKKNCDKFTAPCRARFVMATNSLPTFFDRSDGIWRRLRIIPFSEQITDAEKDVHLAEKIIATELPGIMAWVLEGLADVIRMGNIPDCPAGKLKKEKHRLSCDHEQQFILEKYEAGKRGDRIRAADVYASYRNWMDASGYKAMGASKFYARFEDIFPQTELKDMRINNVVVKGFEGVREIIYVDQTEDFVAHVAYP